MLTSLHPDSALRNPDSRAAIRAARWPVLVPELRPGDIVIMDYLSSHEGTGDRERITAASAELLLPTCSPDLNLIERAFSRLKANSRKAAERTVEGLWKAIARILESIQSQECLCHVGS